MSTDAIVRRGANGLEVFDFGTTACTTAPPLSEARVAIVTTAGLRPDGVATVVAGARVRCSRWRSAVRDVGPFLRQLRPYRPGRPTSTWCTPSTGSPNWPNRVDRIGRIAAPVVHGRPARPHPDHVAARHRPGGC